MINSIISLYHNITGSSILGKIGLSLGALFMGYIAPIKFLLLSCFILTVTDLIYGLRVAHKQHQKITSDKTWHGTIAKIFDEFVIIVLARILEHAVLGLDKVFWLTGGITVLIGLTELWSIIENLNTLDPNGPWKVIGKFLQKKGEDYTGINLNKNENSDDITVDE